MSDRYFEILRDSFQGGNYIPSGRQLPRTPPLTDVQKHLDFSNDDSIEDCEITEQAGTRGRDDSDLNRTFDFNSPQMKTEPDDHSMLKGMKGYQLTQSDLEFIKNMQEEKLIKKLQRDLEELQRLLKNEIMAMEMIFANRDQAQAELKKFPTCRELTEWVKVVLKMTLPSAELADLDTKSLLAMVTKEDIQRVIDEKNIELARMRNMLENKRKKEAEEGELLEKQMASKQWKIQGLMSELSALKLELAQQEESYKAREMQIKNQEAPKLKVEAETVDMSEELQDAKSQVKRRGKERKKVVKSTEKLHDATNQSKSTRSRLADSKADNQTGVKDDHANKNTGETLKTKPDKNKSGAAGEKPTKSVESARGPQQKESNPHESEQALTKRRRPPGRAQATDSQLKNQCEAETGEALSRNRLEAADAGEVAPNVGLRRSKRIASRS